MVASDMALEVIADVTVVWLLSTKRSFKQPSKSAFARWSAALPAHALQVSSGPSASASLQALLSREFVHRSILPARTPIISHLPSSQCQL